MLKRSIATIVLVIVPAFHALAQVSPPAVLTPTDPALRLWLKTDAGLTVGNTTEGQPGPPVLQWVDQSQYGTIMAPRTTSNPAGAIGGFPVEEHPHLVTSTLNGRSFPTIRFDRDGDIFETGDPAIDGSGSTDRLYQTNNLGANDPLNIGDGSDLTTFVVFNPDFTKQLVLGQYQALFTKRGASSAVYGFQIKRLSATDGRFWNISYDATEQYLTQASREEKVWQMASMAIEDHPGSENVDTIHFYGDESQSDTQKMVDLGVTDRNGVNPVSTIASRAASTPEPFGIGGHSQPCCGEGETFAGNIAEIIIFARKLTAQEFSDVENYLDAKYFAAAPGGVPGDYNGNGAVDAADYTVWRDNFGQFFALQNAKPGAATEGFVDEEDYDFWQSNFGAGAGGIAGLGAVPEPSSCVLLLGMIALGAATRCRRQ